MTARRWYTVPDGPVVYRCYSADDRLLYIGVSGSPLARIGSHIVGTRWWGEVDRVEFELHDTMADALAAESAAIASEPTVHNRAGTARDGRHRRGVATA